MIVFIFSLYFGVQQLTDWRIEMEDGGERLPRQPPPPLAAMAEVVWYNNVRTAQDMRTRYNMIFFRALADFCYKARQGYRQKTTIFAVDRGMAP